MESDDNNRLTKQLEQIAEDFCDNYCKYPGIWDEEKEGIELSESYICANCLMSKILGGGTHGKEKTQSFI